jgi:PAS domain S-box-containing protein
MMQPIMPRPVPSSNADAARAAGSRRGRSRDDTLRETEPQYRVLFEQHPHPTWVLDTDTLRFLAVNDAALAEYGFSRREFLAMSIRDIRSAALDGSPLVPTLELHRRKSGEVFEVEAHRNTVRFRGRPAQLVTAIDISRRLQAERELKRLHAEQERRRLARELHDEFGQTLTGLKLTLQAIAKDEGNQRERLQWAESLVDTLMKQTRELSTSLRPPVLDDLGLLPALLTHLDRFGAQTAVRVQFTHAGIDRRFAPQLETAVFRIVQEALTNVARHAGVSTARLWVRRDAAELCVIVEDEGRGIAATGVMRATAGLDGMRERAALVGGRLIVDAPEAGGTRVTAILPL